MGAAGQQLGPVLSVYQSMSSTVGSSQESKSSTRNL